MITLSKHEAVYDRDYVEGLEEKLDTAWEDSSAWESAANSYKDEVKKLKARVDKACDELERLRDEPEIPIPIPEHLPQIDDILFDLEGGEESFVLSLEK